MNEQLALDFAPAIARCLAYPEPPGPELILLVQNVLNLPEEVELADLEAMQRRIEALPAANRQVALVYGGATKIKGYVFEAAKLPEIRGASALLDWVNEVALPQHWGISALDPDPIKQLHQLVEQGIVYASGGNLLAFAPAEMGPELARAIEHSYTQHTLTANSVAVSAPFRLLELRFGRLYRGDQRDKPYWTDAFLADCKDGAKRQVLLSYYYPPEGIAEDDYSEAALRRRFLNRKTFGELVTVLASMANRRRDERARHGEARSVPLYALNPWAAKCDSSDVRPAIYSGTVGDELSPRELSEASARKRYVGQLLKVAEAERELATAWFREHVDAWDQPAGLAQRSWEQRWREYLRTNPQTAYAQYQEAMVAQPAEDVGQIGQASDPHRYIGVIYADGNNVGRLIATLKTPAEYARISAILRDAAQSAVFKAFAQHLRPVTIRDQERGRRRTIHPFEILTIGGDDLLVIVPGDKALAIALAIGTSFEQMLAEWAAKGVLPLPPDARSTGSAMGRYALKTPVSDTAITPVIGLSAGVVIAQENTPIFFLRDLVEELLKGAKGLAKSHAKASFYGGAVDFMVLKSVSMVTNNIRAFRKAALGDGVDPDQPFTKERPFYFTGSATFARRSEDRPVVQNERRLTARPYSWHEFAGLLSLVHALKAVNAPRSQLYRLQQSLTASSRGINPSVVEYLYSRSRTTSALADVLVRYFEQPWHASPRLDGRTALPPWIPRAGANNFETIWPDLLEIYDLVAPEDQP